jgi:hypothetical protein
MKKIKPLSFTEIVPVKNNKEFLNACEEILASMSTVLPANFECRKKFARLLHREIGTVLSEDRTVH